MREALLIGGFIGMLMILAMLGSNMDNNAKLERMKLCGQHPELKECK